LKRFFFIFILLFLVSIMVFHTGCRKSEINNPPDMSIVGVKWVLESIQYSAVNLTPIVETFYILLYEDFSLDMEVDCNYCAGEYILGNNNSILFDYSTIACTEAYCGEDSWDDEFHDALNTATKYEVDSNRLRVYFNNESSQLNFITNPSARGTY
jgi:heat shock protein HslJ